MMKICPNCKREYIVLLSYNPDFRKKYHKWAQERKLVQNVWPDATANQREQLQTGICSDECWDEYLGVLGTEDQGIMKDNSGPLFPYQDDKTDEHDNEPEDLESDEESLPSGHYPHN